MPSSDPPEQGSGQNDIPHALPPEPTRPSSGKVRAIGLRRPLPPRTRLVLSFATLGVIFSFTLCSIWLDATARQWHAIPYSVAFALLIGLTIAHGALLYRAPQRRRGRPRTEHIDGQAWTLLPNATSLFAVLAGAMGSLALLPALIAIGVLFERNPGAVILWSAIALVLGSYLVDVATGRLAVGYVALSPDGVRQRGRSFESFLPWDSVHRVLPPPAGAPIAVIAPSHAAAGERRRTSLWKIDRLPVPGAMNIDTEISALPPTLVLDVLTFYTEYPEARAELGTPAAITRFAATPQNQNRRG